MPKEFVKLRLEEQETFKKSHLIKKKYFQKLQEERKDLQEQRRVLVKLKKILEELEKQQLNEF